MPGIYPAVMTAYNHDGSISVDSTIGHVDRLVDEGANGLFVGGTAGEGLMQTADERIRINSAILERVSGRLPCIVHVGSTVFDEAVKVARHALDDGASEVAAIPPLYYALQDHDVDDYFVQFRHAIQRPFFAYHVPNLTHRTTTADRIVALAERGVLSGIKYSADDVAELQTIVERTGGLPFETYSGTDPMFLDAQVFGSSGAVGVSMNALTRLFADQWTAVTAGDLAGAFDSQRLINKFVARMVRYNFIAYLRVVLEAQGIAVGKPRMPLPRLTADDERSIISELSSDEELRVALRLPEYSR